MRAVHFAKLARSSNYAISLFRVGVLASLGCFLAECGVVVAAWPVADAPLRVSVRLGKNQPSIPDGGYLIELPELGLTMPSLADVILTDEKGASQPLAKVWRGEGQSVLLLAQTLAAGQDYFLYFGGNRPRRGAEWAPKTSLFMETRRLPAAPRFDDWSGIEATWRNAKEIDGAGFVGSIDHGENPFGESRDFLSHYTGWLITDGKPVTLYTLSSDASFVGVSDKFAFGWPGVHTALANAKSVPRKEISTQVGATRVEYYQAKVGEGNPTMLLGWVKDGKNVRIPASAWVHPGSAEVGRIEESRGWPVPTLEVKITSFIGWNDLWLYDVQFTVRESLPEGWSAEWTFDDGSKMPGASCERVMSGLRPHVATLQLTRGKDELRLVRKVTFAGSIPQAMTEDVQTQRHYLELMGKENPALLSKETLRADFQFLVEFGNDQQIGKFATAWVAKNPDPNDPLWISAQLAKLRAQAQTDPQGALAEFRKFDFNARKKYAKELGMGELDVLVFDLKNIAAVQTANRLAFENPNSDYARVVKIRVGDLYRLLGKTKEAVEQYRAVQKTGDDETQGRKYAAQDRAYSIEIADLISGGYRHEAEAKSAEWELAHPMAKYESDFLLVRAQVLMLFGRWNEALQEIDSFRQMQPDSPYQIPADFYRARALYELGKKDEAKKIWTMIAANYPKHELADESRRLSKQP